MPPHRFEVAADAAVVGHEFGRPLKPGGGFFPVFLLPGHQAEGEVQFAGLAGSRDAINQQPGGGVELPARDDRPGSGA